MLPFGSITSIIPLFVFALAYVLYFGTSALSRTKADEPLLSADTEKKEISIDAKSRRLSEKTFSFSVTVIDSEACAEDTAEKVYTEIISLFPGLPDDRIYSQFTWSGIFSRPPPLS